MNNLARDLEWMAPFTRLQACDSPNFSIPRNQLLNTLKPESKESYSHEQTTPHPAPCDPRPGGSRAVLKCTSPTALRIAIGANTQAFSPSGHGQGWQADRGGVQGRPATVPTIQAGECAPGRSSANEAGI